MGSKTPSGYITPDCASGLAGLVYAHASQNPEHPAIVIDEVTFSYAKLISLVGQLAAYLEKHCIQRIGVLASRSLEAYAAILAAHWTGAAYVPLNPAFPGLRLKKIIKEAQLDAIVVDPSGLSGLNTSAFQFTSEMPIISPVSHLDAPSPNFQIINPEEIKKISALKSAPVQVAASDLAYIIFTSGTTGSPKGVPISFGNLGVFIEEIKKRYLLNSQDRVSQFSSLCFDVSIFDMCLAWGAGATLYVVPEKMLLGPASFIRDNELTVWLSVPIVIGIMSRLNMLKPDSFPSLKYSLFTGEALTLQHVKQWQQAAPKSQMENLYGPTEGTIDCLAQVVNHDIENACYNDLIPIGKSFTHVYAGLINSENTFLSLGEKGELVISGPQIALGYWQDAELSRQKFVKLDHPHWGVRVWYLTGDYCYQDTSGAFHYLYRLDNQCKINGQRIELNEIEYHIRDLTKCNEVVALVISSDSYPHQQIIAVVDLPDLDGDKLKSQLKEYLPVYMVPEHIIYMDNLFYSANGKVDRKLLTEAMVQKFNLN